MSNYDPNALADLRGDGLDGDGHDEGREELAADILGASLFKKMKKAVKKVASAPSRITKPLARVVGKVPVIGRPAASGLRAAAKLANPLSVLRPKSFVKTQVRAVTSPLSAVRSLVKKPAARKPPIAQRARPSWAKPLPAKPVARPAPRAVVRAAPKPVARPVVRAAPKPVARPAPRPVVQAAPKPVARPAPTSVARPAPKPTPSWAPAPSILPEPTAPAEALEPMIQEEQPFEEQAPEEQPFEEQAPEEQPLEEEQAPEEQPLEEEEPLEEEPADTEEPPAGWEEET